MFDIVGLGASLYDIIMVTDDYPQEDTKVRTDTVINQCGGPAATGIVAASKLGASTTFLGTFSDDGYSQIMLDEFRHYSVNTSYAVIRKGYTSAFAFIIASKKNSSRTVIWTKGSLPSPLPEDIPEDVIKRAKVLYLDGNHLEASLYACEIAKKNGVKILLDAGNTYPHIEEIVKVTDLLIVSEEFSMKYTAKKTAEDGAQELYKEYHPEVLVVTQGKNGGFYYHNRECIYYPAYPVPGGVMDTTGAGDVFHGAFAFSYIKGWDINECVRFSSAVSALKCTKLGGRSGIPEYDEVIKHMKLFNQEAFL